MGAPLVARKINYYDMRKLKMTDTTKILNLITDDLSLLDGRLENIALLLHTHVLLTESYEVDKLSWFTSHNDSDYLVL